MALTATGIAGKTSDMDESQRNTTTGERAKDCKKQIGWVDRPGRRAARDITATGSSSGLSFAERQLLVAPSKGWERAREGTGGSRRGGATGAIRAGRLEIDSEGPMGR
ncbi:oxidoreductase domain containing protein [Aspergillus luchuensis]|uniref:Oxidoreductase domain containing protein n=1 Tax=Aspergillus kawachii TaxID=1069201 RepID=A0A146F225_ASPKA|nr:oxidoreductase domain containing protein [Aspergillus luchuensis]